MLSIWQFFTKNSMTPVPHLSYSPNLALSDFFFLFPWMKNVLKEKHFADVEEVKEKTAEASKSTSSKTVLSSGKNTSIGVLHQMESALKVTKV